jgi:hypothetical protein
MTEYFILSAIGVLAAVFLVVWFRKKKCNCDTCPSKSCPSRKKDGQPPENKS